MKIKCQDCIYFEKLGKLGKLEGDEVEYGTCRIRSVNSPIFPQRHLSAWCGEFIRNK